MSNRLLHKPKAPEWRAVPRMDFHRLHEARLQAHYAVQWLARLARAAIPERSDDSHANFGWDHAFGGLTTHQLPDGSRLGLRIADLTLAFLDKAPAELSLDGRTDTEVRRWVAGQKAARGLPGDLDTPLPYELPHHVVELGARYSLEELVPAFEVLSVWFSNATDILEYVRGKLAGKKLGGPVPRCWPHHFDMDVIVSFGRDQGMGVGFSPGDTYCDEPHFYLTIYPEPSIPGLPLLPAVGYWHTYKFLAAVAPAHKVVAATNPIAYCDNFFDVAISGALAARK